MSDPDSAASTRWTLVRRAGRQNPAAEAALAELCELYWQPVFCFLRSEGRTEDAARELTQAFFARLLQSGRVDTADPSRGRFRSYLLGAVKHFLHDERAHAHRLKRGGGFAHEPLPDDTSHAGHAHDGHAHAGHAHAGHAHPPSVAPAPDSRFDRAWAFHVLEQALRALEAEQRAQGKAELFAVLKPWLTGACASLSQAQAASQLGLSEGATKVAIHRLRQRFRDIIRRTIAQTVERPEDVDDEVRYLVEVLSSSVG